MSPNVSRTRYVNEEALLGGDSLSYIPLPHLHSFLTHWLDTESTMELSC